MFTASHGLPAGEYRFEVEFQKVTQASSLTLSVGSQGTGCSLVVSDNVQVCKMTSQFTGGGSVLQLHLIVQNGGTLIPTRVTLHRLK
jgi:hypothetical protein